VWRIAHELGVRGRVRNDREGTCIEAFGSEPALAAFRRRLEQPALPGTRLETVTVADVDGGGPPDFSIVESDLRDAGRRLDVALAPDLPTCPDCLEELFDPRSRRHRYPFIACAQCGPRYTAARDLPWDRARTAMSDFPLCPECASEYARPSDRRFHAEAIACAACGPSLRCEASGHDGRVAFADAALADAVDVLRGGGVVAVQGVGGFHLACDATDERSVARLRERKRRPRKPLAVMVRSCAEAEKHAVIRARERVLLQGEARPIVLLRRRSDSSLAASIAPGSPMLGLLLAYTPLHELLLADLGKPLVMTSANHSGEPIVYRSGDAGALADLADAVLSHDREIVAPCDDSVALSAASGPILIRRSRGHVPRPIRLATPLRHTVVACGGQWSNTLCIASEDRAWLSAHIGDVESPESVARLADTTRRWLDWLGLEPEVVAHDLHPRYESTRFAHSLESLRQVGVQHHHAHMASVLAEHGCETPALALTWDGTGAGSDGTAWGGELLFGHYGCFERLATFRPIALAGGERAIREPWRLALALLDDAFDGRAPWDALGLFHHVSATDRERVRSLLARRDLCPDAHGVGRYFDAIGALLLERPGAGFTGELALGLNALCSERPAEPYPFAVETGSTPWAIDLRSGVRVLVEELLRGRPRSEIADRFHATLVAAGEAVVRATLEADSRPAGVGPTARPPVVLAGGCFQNRILVEGLERSLAAAFEVMRPRSVPPGDGGLALGQALVADAVVSNAEES
jgi:hydrogenase maturation protein HypF